MMAVAGLSQKSQHEQALDLKKLEDSTEGRQALELCRWPPRE